MKPTAPFLAVSALAALLLLGSGSASRASTAIQIDPGTDPLVAFDPEFVFGWEFLLSAPIQIHHIGLFDSGGDGFERPWKVNIWSLDGLGTNSIDFGSGTLTENGFSFVETFVELDPYGGVHGPTLQPGRYVIAAGGLSFADGDGGVADDLMPAQAAAILTDPVITFVQSRSGMNTLHDEDLVFPDTAEPGLKYFGPNFQFDVVPEPSVPLLLALGMLGCARRKMRLSVR
jgi:hypothetical protein